MYIVRPILRISTQNLYHFDFNPLLYFRPRKIIAILGSCLQRHHDITRENLRILMTSFYDRVIEDEVLAPYFTGELGDDLAEEDWVEHDSA